MQDKFWLYFSKFKEYYCEGRDFRKRLYSELLRYVFYIFQSDHGKVNVDSAIYSIFSGQKFYLFIKTPVLRRIPPKRDKYSLKLSRFSIVMDSNTMLFSD